jgi:type VI secretion system protein ImpK
VSNPTPVVAGRLASLLQEALTAVVRLRAERQPVTDGAAFRAQMVQLLARAEGEATQLGYTAQDARLAIFAVVAFLDESALNTRIPALADWARRPLQDELFGGHMGGEWFFQHVDQLLGRPDSTEVAELLEVYQLCLLLGFRGKYGAGDVAPLQQTMTRIAERLGRMRPALKDLAPRWQPPADAVSTRDPWVKPLAIGALVALIAMFSLWGVYGLLLRSGLTSLHALAPATASASTR